MMASELFTPDELRIRRWWLLIVGIVGLLLVAPLTLLMTLLIPFQSLLGNFLFVLFLLGSPTSTLLAWWLMVHRKVHLQVVDGLKAGLLASLIGFVVVIGGLTLSLRELIIIVFFYALAFCITVVAPIGLALGATFVTLEKLSLAHLDQKRMSTTHPNAPAQEPTKKSII